MSGVPPPLRWWGWGDRETEVPPGLAVLLHDEVSVPLGTRTPPTPRDAVTPRPSALAGDALVAQLAAALGPDAVRLDDATRLAHAGGRSYLDLLRLRSEDVGDVPDAVVFPAGEAQVAATLAACASAGCAVVPYGGGTSVVGGVSALRGAHRAVLALSLRRLDALISADEESLLATLGAGMTGPQAEAALGARGLTLGHFPQSFEYATIGGFAATRSAGQASSGYGRFDEMVAGLRVVTPTGILEVRPHPASAAGPSLRQLVLGSEGRLGVITEVTVRVRRRPTVSRYEAWSIARFEAGLAALRGMAQGHIVPDVARLSDAEETRVSLALAAQGGARDALARAYLRARGQAGGCRVILGWDSDAALGGARQAEARAMLRARGAVPLGASPGRAWQRQRYHAPYLRDALMDSGVLAETLETATSWANVGHLHAAVGAAIRDALAGGPAGALVGCHVSHVYPGGASLYFTALARAGDDPGPRWRTAKAAACEAILDGGGTITHHHAVGTDHAGYLEREVGREGLAALGALAAQVDPAGIMNPGKLLPDAPPRRRPARRRR